MQTLWQCNVDWDEPLSDKDQREWLNIAHNIQEAMRVTIPRQYFSKDNTTTKQPRKLHIFADTSPIAYVAM